MRQDDQDQIDGVSNWSSSGLGHGNRASYGKSYTPYLSDLGHGNRASYGKPYSPYSSDLGHGNRASYGKPSSPHSLREQCWHIESNNCTCTWTSKSAMSARPSRISSTDNILCAAHRQIQAGPIQINTSRQRQQKQGMDGRWKNRQDKQ